MAKKIFGYFEIEHVFQALADYASDEPERLCGNMKEGAWYITGPLFEYPTPKPYTGPSYVGFRYTERVTLGE
jgi:hypothetical protein